MEESRNSNAKAVLFEWMESLITSIVIVSLLFTLVFRVVNIRGQSMENTLFNGDKVILTNFLYKPVNEDVIVVAKGQNFYEPIIKRVIALEGQTIDINFITGEVKVDDQVLDEPYIKNATVSNEGMTFPITVPKGHIFVMGDNRMNSKDSRSPQIGLIDERDVVGKAQFIVFPFNRFGSVNK